MAYDAPVKLLLDDLCVDKLVVRVLNSLELNIIPNNILVVHHAGMVESPTVIIKLYCL